MVKKFGLSVLKIDLNRVRKSNISFYRDTAMGEDAGEPSGGINGGWQEQMI